MSNKPKMTKDTVPDDFTLSLAAVDALPVLFFGGSIIFIGLMFKNALFLIGAVLCFWAGAAKVLWKIIVVTKKKNIWWLFMQMRIVMPFGFALMIIAVILSRSTINLSAVLAAAVNITVREQLDNDHQQQTLHLRCLLFVFSVLDFFRIFCSRQTTIL